jgi:hypothetical protein
MRVLFINTMSKRVSLNVGGTVFETTRSTLEKSGYFKALLTFRDNNSDNGEIFIDRDPDHFKHVLSLLRDTRYNFPEELNYELEFYQIETNEPEPEPNENDPFEGHLTPNQALKALRDLSFGIDHFRKNIHSSKVQTKIKDSEDFNKYNVRFVDSLLVIDGEIQNDKSVFRISRDICDQLLYIVYDFAIPGNCPEAEIHLSGCLFRKLDNYTIFHPIPISPFNQTEIIFNKKANTQTLPRKLRIGVRYYTSAEFRSEREGKEFVSVEHNIVKQKYGSTISLFVPTPPWANFEQYAKEEK